MATVDGITGEVFMKAVGGLVPANILERSFKSGSRGYHVSGKLELDGKRYQANIQLVEIGSKAP